MLEWIIEHPWFQRLRRIRQTGLTEYVYPGALHTRFHHALGAMHLMGLALDTLRSKSIDISNEEYEAAMAAILLHDIGHGPFSHSLESVLLPGVRHESMTYLIMKALNQESGERLDLALRIFRNSYERKFFHALVSSQIDTDRLDYLNRDSFYTGVSEGKISVRRIIQLLNVVDDQIVVEEKGLYNIENMLHARRFMYWQVYLHKTALSAEKLLGNIILRAQVLSGANVDTPCSEALRIFLTTEADLDSFTKDPQMINQFARLDDYDVWGAVKMWMNLKDPILADLCSRLLDRKLFKIRLDNEPIKRGELLKLKDSIHHNMGILKKDTVYYMAQGMVTNAAYVAEGQTINILTRKGQVVDITQVSDLPHIGTMGKIVKKYYLSWPKNISL